jgi:hypothetical protein
MSLNGVPIMFPDGSLPEIGHQETLNVFNMPEKLYN